MVEEIPKVAEFECELGVYMGVLYKYPIEGHQITEEKMIIIYTNIYNKWIWRYTIFRPKWKWTILTQIHARFSVPGPADRV